MFGSSASKRLEVADCYNLLALINKKQGHYVKAKELYNESISIVESLLGKK